MKDEDFDLLLKKQMQKDKYLMHFLYAIGDSIEEKDAVAFCQNLVGNNILSNREMQIICAALSEQTLGDIPPENRAHIRAKIFVHIILSLMQ